MSPWYLAADGLVSSRGRGYVDGAADNTWLSSWLRRGGQCALEASTARLAHGSLIAS